MVGILIQAERVHSMYWWRRKPKIQQLYNNTTNSSGWEDTIEGVLKEWLICLETTLIILNRSAPANSALEMLWEWELQTRERQLVGKLVRANLWLWANPIVSRQLRDQPLSEQLTPITWSRVKSLIYSSIVRVSEKAVSWRRAWGVTKNRIWSLLCLWATEKEKANSSTAVTTIKNWQFRKS